MGARGAGMRNCAVNEASRGSKLTNSNLKQIFFFIADSTKHRNSRQMVGPHRLLKIFVFFSCLTLI